MKPLIKVRIVRKEPKTRATKPPPAAAPPGRALIYLSRGTAVEHEALWRSIPEGNFTLVTDLAELRFHDGVTPGGFPVPIPSAVIQLVREAYARLDRQSTQSTTTEKEAHERKTSTDPAA